MAQARLTVRHYVEAHRRMRDLYPCEARLLALLEKALPNKEIAAVTGLSEMTVKAYLSRAFEVLGVHSRAEAMRVLFDRRCAACGFRKRAEREFGLTGKDGE